MFEYGMSLILTLDNIIIYIGMQMAIVIIGGCGFRSC